MDVYNWVGSLNVEPEFFEILDYKGKFVYPADDVESGLYNMEIRQSAINMSHHGEIAFNEFGTSNEMVAAENHSTSKDATSYKSFREDLLYRQGNLEVVTCQVRRDKIYSDILELYNDNKKSKKFVIYFENKEAVGEGVTRIHMHCFLNTCIEVSSKEKTENSSVNCESGISAENRFYHSKCFYPLRSVSR